MESNNFLPIKDIKSSREKVAVEKVNQTIDFLGDSLEIPKDRLDNARKSSVYVVDKDTFFDELTKHIKELGVKVPEEFIIEEAKSESMETIAEVFGTSVEEIKSKKRGELEKFYREYSLTKGISIISDNGEKTILINGDEVTEEKRDEAMSHELLHSMVDTINQGSGFNSKTGFGHNLNEATVQLMNLRAKYKEMDWEGFSKGIFDGSIESVGYREEMGTLLVLMRATSFGKDEYTFDKLKEEYFDKGEASEKAFLVKMSLIRGVPDVIGGKNGMRAEMQKLFERKLERAR